MDEEMIFLHCWPAELVCYSAMGLWVDRWPGERELIPNITAKNINEAFKTCLGTKSRWCDDRWKCSVCGIEMPAVHQAEDHPITKEVFSETAIGRAIAHREAREARKVRQAVQPGGEVYVVPQADA